MKKVLSYILISLIIFANLFAPISVGLGEKNNIKITKNEARAAGEVVYIGASSDTDTSVGINGGFFTTEKLPSVLAYYNIGSGNPITTTNGATFMASEGTLSDITTKDAQGNILYKYTFGTTIRQRDLSSNSNLTFTTGNTYYVEAQIKKLATDTTFIATSATESFVLGTPSTYGYLYMPADKIAQTDIYNNGIIQGLSQQEAQRLVRSTTQQQIDAKNAAQGGLPSCGVVFGSISGCVAQIIYYLLFVPTSYLFALSGAFFDNTFSYSVQSSSYQSSFVVQGWGLVRDFCNMFFIFIMLYIAISTILNIHNFNTKSTIINVIVIGLFINFSLFATQVIIDSSNIMARVFYNADTIKVTEKGVDGATNVISAIGPDGIIPLSAALVNKVNPQNIIIHSDKVGDIPDKTGKGTSIGVNNSSFMLITLLATGINIVGFVIFLSVGLIFVVRVVGLWVAMIISPLAFFTYILPEQMAGWKMVGWKNWWPETLKLAFLAPIFIFFLYLILKFLELDLVSSSQGTTGIPFVIATIIPFAFIMVLMMKAKKIAVDMSGEIGAAASKMGAAAGGLALGAATGGAAFAMRNTIGRAGNAIADSDRLKAAADKKGIAGFAARSLRSFGKGAGGATFDARNTQAGALAGSNLGVKLGKAKEGGFKKDKEDKIKKDVARAKDLELGPDSELVKDKRKKDIQLKEIQRKHGPDLDKLDKDLTGARQASTDANAALAADPKDKKKQEAAKLASEKVTEINAKKAYIKNGGEIMEDEKDNNGNVVMENGKAKQKGTGKFYTDNGKITSDAADSILKAIKDQADALEKKAKEIEELSASIDKDSSYSVADKTKAKDDAIKAREQSTNFNSNELKTATDTHIKQKIDSGKSMKQIETVDIPEAQRKIDETNTDRHFNEAARQEDKKSGAWNKTKRAFSGSSASGIDEAVYNIRMDTKIDAK